ncbi:hypothetical protein ABZ079_27875 [Streptomyces sp. NPDC006314]|uniref:hypothetical protein n=1 Tax=Streptomyces sp. NPDC006314 TaxID=3154475 RepID=UPI0033AC3AAF
MVEGEVAAGFGEQVLVLLLPADFRLRPLGALADLAPLTAFGICIGALSFALALHSRKQ